MSTTLVAQRSGFKLSPAIYLLQIPQSSYTQASYLQNGYINHPVLDFLKGCSRGSKSMLVNYKMRIITAPPPQGSSED